MTPAPHHFFVFVDKKKEDHILEVMLLAALGYNQLDENEGYIALYMKIDESELDNPAGISLPPTQ